jgi:hypothetical protein
MGPLTEYELGGGYSWKLLGGGMSAVARHDGAF